MIKALFFLGLLMIFIGFCQAIAPFFGDDATVDPNTKDTLLVLAGSLAEKEADVVDPPAEEEVVVKETPSSNNSDNKQSGSGNDGKQEDTTYSVPPGFFGKLFEESIEGLSILAAILLITTISAANDYIKEKQFIDLMEVAKDYDVSCIRGQHGTTAPINAWELVVGDLITFEAGDRIPADCLLLESIDLRVDEAYHHDDVKTIVDKHESNAENLLENHDSFLMAESLVVEGSGRALILVVYEPFCSRHRRVLRQDEDDAEVSPLKERLANIGSQIGKLGIYAAIILFAILIVRTVINLMAQENTKLMSADTLKNLLTILTTCITLVMVAVPEGLPLSVSISVAFSLSKMK
jgi:Ca2+-transporting ATPase